MGRTHDITISGFDLDRIEASNRKLRDKNTRLRNGLRLLANDVSELREERDAAICMAWELVQKLAQKCSDPIHKKQLEQIRQLHADYLFPNVRDDRQLPAASRPETKSDENSG
jgi:hypothetical protein